MTQVPNWDNARCREMGTVLFFPESRQDTINLLPHIQQICFECPIFDKCLQYALNNRVDGLWAGTDEPTRQTLRKSLNITPRPLVDLGDYFVSQTDEAKAARKKRALLAAETRKQREGLKV